MQLSLKDRMDSRPGPEGRATFVFHARANIRIARFGAPLTYRVPHARPIASRTLWLQPAVFHDVHAWLASHSIVAVAELELVHQRPWSTVLRFRLRLTTRF